MQRIASERKLDSWLKKGWRVVDTVSRGTAADPRYLIEKDEDPVEVPAAKNPEPKRRRKKAQ